MVCCNDTVVPAKDSTVITAHVGTCFGAAAAIASAVMRPPQRRRIYVCTIPVTPVTVLPPIQMSLPI